MKPEKLRLGAHEWKILWEEVPKKMLEEFDLEEASGLFHDPNGVVYVVPEYSTQRQKVTLLHEAIHAIALCHGLDLKEIEVEVLGNALYDFIIQNTEIISWIREQ